MKKIYLLLAVILQSALINPLYNQCNFTRPGVELIAVPYTDPITGNCMIKIDLYFDLQSNAGGKYVYVHIWRTPDYPNLDYSSSPHAAELANSVATVGFYHHANDLYMLNSYTPDPTISNFQYNNILISKGPGDVAGYDKFEVENLLFASPVSCSTPQSFIADLWESQSAQGQVVHCFSKGLTFYANDPKATGLLYCNVPRTFQFNINTINTSGMVVDYKVFIDDGDRVYNKTLDTLQVGQGNNISLEAANNFSYTSAILSYAPYSSTKPYADKSLWLVVSSASINNEVYTRLDNNCISLPVVLKNFTAIRKDNIVNLSWTTATEVNNKGFYIERKNSNSDWMIQGFVASAIGNNTSETLNYSFTDNNTEKNNSFYRLRQVDLDDHATLSEIKLVAGKDYRGRIMVYPNPANTGELNLVFTKGETLAEIKLINMNGQTVRQWSNFIGTKINVNTIPAGVYNLAIRTSENQEQFNIKVVIK